MEYVEYQVADECNLKCKGCLHFSNLVSAPVHPILGEFERSLIHLKGKFSNIATFRLMGGEPLLNEE